MPDLMSFLRLKNIFGQPPIVGNDLPSQGGFSGSMETPEFSDMFSPKQDPYGNIAIGPKTRAIPAMALPAQESPDMGFDPSARMHELYTPEMGASERFNSLIDKYPDRENYKPSVLRRIGAGLVGAFGSRGPEQGINFRNAPYNNALSDWKTQMGPAQQAAALERQTNANNRQLATSTVNEELTNRRIDEKSKIDDRNAKIREDRAEVYRLKSLGPNYKFDFKGPKVIVTDSSTGKVQVTDVDTGSLSDTDKMALQQDNAMEQIGARGDQARQTENVRQGNRESLQETRGWGQPVNITDPNDPTKQIAVSINQITGEVKKISLDNQNIGDIHKPGTDKGGVMEPPTQTKIRQFNAARQIKTSDPQLGAYITIGPGSGDFSVRPPGGFRGPTQEQYDKIVGSIYGQGMPAINQPTRTGATPAPKIIRQRSPSTGQIRESKDGGKTWQVVSK